MQHSAFSTFTRFCRRIFQTSLIIASYPALAAPIYYNPWDRVPVASAELACKRTIDYFSNNPPNTYVDWIFDRAEFGQDFDSRVAGANGNYFGGGCRFLHSPELSGGFFYLPFEVVCLSGYIIIKKDSPVAQCITEGLNLTLTPAPNQKDPRPKGTEGKDGKSTLELIARVTENGNPKAGVAVTFAVAVEANSGGHDHHDASRPEGELLQDEDVTDVNGEIKLRFEAPEFAGTHVVAAFCSKCANTSVTKNINVKVPNLIELEGDYSRTAKYELIGSTPKHQGNHFFAPEALIALRKLLPIFAKYDWGVVGINDSSLKWGGRFDIAGRWNGSHHEHLEGKEVDLSFYKPFGTISEKNRQKVYDDLFESKGVGTPQVLWHLKDNPATPSYAHFHVYLLGQSFFRKKPY